MTLWKSNIAGKDDPPDEWGYYLADPPYIGGCEPYLTDLCKIIKANLTAEQWFLLGITE